MIIGDLSELFPQKGEPHGKAAIESGFSALYKSVLSLPSIDGQCSIHLHRRT